MRAIEAKELLAFRDNRNRWQITRQELENWAHAHRALSEQSSPDAHSDAHLAQPDDHFPKADQDTLANDLASARLTIAQLEVRLEERAALVGAAEARAQMAEADRDRWRALAEKLADRPTAPSADSASSLTSPPRRWRFWRRG